MPRLSLSKRITHAFGLTAKPCLIPKCKAIFCRGEEDYKLSTENPVQGKWAWRARENLSLKKPRGDPDASKMRERETCNVHRHMALKHRGELSPIARSKYGAEIHAFTSHKLTGLLFRHSRSA